MFGFKGKSSVFGIYRIGLENPNGFLSFPLKGFTPYTANISAVFDHSQPNNCPDGSVLAFTNERGETQFGVSILNTIKSGSDACPAYKPQGVRQELGKPFTVTGYYGTHTSDPDAKLFLYYDGHTGYDYPVPNGTIVYPAADGDVIKVVASDDVGENEVAVAHKDGYTTHYLHFRKTFVSEGQMVTEGETQLGEVGADHLHFTVKRNNQRVDPYGWLGESGKDPWPVDGHDNVVLWRSVRPVK